MSVRRYAHAYQCPGCAKVFDLVTVLRESEIAQKSNPAPWIATEKMLTERKAANEHARAGCRRPV